MEMEKEENSSLEESEIQTPEPLSEDEVNMILSRQDELEDASAIPPPNKKAPGKLRTYAKKNTFMTVLIAIFSVAFIGAIILLSVYLANTLSANSKRDYVFTLGEEKTRVKYEETVINNVIYIDMNLLAKYAEFSVSGSEESMKYIASGDNYMKFTNDSEYAIINGQKVKLPAPAIVGNGKCLVPYQSVIKAVSDGLTFRSNSKKHKIEITRDTYKQEGVEYKTDITFSTEKFEVVASLVDTSGVTYSYSGDVSSFLHYIAPEDSKGFLMLVNPSNALPPEYVPGDLSTIPSKYTAQDDSYRLSLYAERALYAMLWDMTAELGNAAPYVTSAYRSYEYQESLFESYVKDHLKEHGCSRDCAVAEVLRTSALPGTSEHQSGLCVDFLAGGVTSLTNEQFTKTAAFEWLSKNAYKYGFILRYPDGKTYSTGYDYESWHYRFVGRDVATVIHYSGICLEEYLELTE
ncbi:MAG: D-alanyl-D-alanine carboxypeptidase family protein [Clostridia bacterium]|nr:D-alanyl-D-alanine carboxypeptidase family protein [Clostridia bacterium]